LNRSAKSTAGLVIIVNYKGEQSTLELLASLDRLRGFSDIDVIVVDNCSGEENLSKLRARVAQLSNVELLESATNRGYFGAAKFAYDHYLARGQALPDWVIVCNHDVIVEDEEFLLKLCYQDCLGLGVIAPRIQLTGSGLDQNPFMKCRPSWLRLASLQLIYSNYLFAAVWDRLFRLKQAFKANRKSGSSACDTKKQEIYAAQGSFLIFARKFFEAGGFLDENLFLYGEEISVAEICRSLNLDIIYEPALTLWHNEHASTGNVLSRFSYNCQKRALKYVSARYLGSAKPVLKPKESGTLTHATD